MSDDTRKLRLRSLQDVKIVPTRYLWENYLPVAELAMLVGKPGVGKSTVAADVAAKLTTGRLSGSFLGRPQTVLYSLTEDAEGVFKARFIAADGDPDRLHVIDVVHGQSDGSPLLVDADLDQLRAAIIDLRPALVVLDALNSSLDGQQNDNSNIRPQLEKLKALAHQTNTAILGIGHFRKSTNGSEPLDSIGGAGAYGQVIRQALGCARDEDEGTCTLSVIKTNGQSLDVASLAYRIEEALVPSDDGGTASVGRVTWLGESETSVRDLLQRTPSGDEDRHERDEAVDWLLGYLAANGGEAPSKDIFKAARSENIAERTLKRARTRAGVDYERTGFPSVTYWRISQSGHSRASQAKASDRGPTGLTVAPLVDPAPSPAREQQGSKGAGDNSAAPLLPSVLPSAEPAPEPVRQLHLACPDHPTEKRAANGKCVGCIVDRANARVRDGDAS
ncbi:MAG: hypothetical protein JWP40_2433 [Blastococcus sp.]|nr:hypothetical protein [Blastococcus sp.]